MGKQNADPNRAKFRKSEAKITKPKGDVWIIWFGLRKQPGCASVGSEQLDHWRVVDRFFAGFDTGLIDLAIGGKLVEDVFGQEVHWNVLRELVGKFWEGRPPSAEAGRHSTTGASSVSALGSKRTNSPLIGLAKS